MKSEYVGLSHGEKVFAQKNMLQSQLEFLSSIKNLKAYKKLRSEEFRLKVELKSKIGALLDDLKRLEKGLPDIGYKGDVVRKQRVSLEKEIGEIRRKLAKLS